MNKREVSVFIVKALLGGAAIGIGAAASLYANSLLGGLAGRAVGACLFSIGLFVIIALK